MKYSIPPLPVLSLLMLVGCGSQHGTQPTTQAPNSLKVSFKKQSTPKDQEVSMSAEMGALNPQQTHSSFYNAMDGVQDCVTAGTRRLNFLSGEVELSVLVNTVGQPLRVWAEHSSLGDRATEQCMFEALRSVSWPPSVGGPQSIASNRFEFPLARGASAPNIWDSGRATEALEPLEGALQECHAANSGEIMITLYVGDSGQVISAGAGHDRKVTDDSIECLLGVLGDAQYPGAEPSPAKMRFQL